MIQIELIETIEISNELGKVLKIEYYITKTITEDFKVIYGILIKKYIITYNLLKFDEEESVLSLTYSRSEIENICKLLYNNEVTPISLLYVLDDYHNDIKSNKLNLI